ncbi:hypothetical protein C1H87_00975 [Flavivirga eckloniae]|uniref:Uncharacterized protein n=2 Tax=Flavivirga eckloniae TaxID=1803846 RepID=A0A2K9PK16_9FLAO|nr:hypothetical protein C1H87_00975 [Flavivirga eckloniae]
MAQSIESKIPNSAEAVISVNGDRLTELVPIAKFNEYSFAQKMLEKLSRNSESELTLNSIEDLGFDVNSKAFYFFKRTDSISYHTFLIKLTDKNKFESLMSPRDKESIVTEEGLRVMAENRLITVWNDNLLLFSAYEKGRPYFKEHEERFMSQMEHEDITYYQLKKALTSKWAKIHAFNVIKGHGETSILSNKSYASSKDKNAAASVWLSDYGQLISDVMFDMYGGNAISSLIPWESISNLYGFKSVVANLYFDKGAARMTTEMEMSSDLIKSSKSFYNSKIDKAFFNYLNYDETLAYMSLSLNTKALLEEYPKLQARVFDRAVPTKKGELDLVVDLLSLLLDEEAISDLITGDVLFTLDNFEEKEVTYTSYEFDEDYNRKETTRTKNEIVPDFTIMIGSKKDKLLNKAARLGVKQKLFEDKNGYFKINIPQKEVPFGLYLYAAIKNDILFFTTSEEKISNIVNNRFIKNPGKHQKLIKSCSSVLYINGEKLISKVPESELSRKERRYFNYAKESLKDAYFKTLKIKGNKLLSEMNINTANSEENSLKLFLNLIDALAK